MAHAALPGADIAGEAMFSGCLAIVPADRRALAAHLPPSLTLPPADAAEYPCLVAFGEHSDGLTFFGGFPMPWNIRYHELMVGVPFVNRKGAEGPQMFVRGMACDFWPAVWNGNVYYGFMKQFARVRWDGRQFVSLGDGERTDFHAAVEKASSTTDGALEWIRAAAALPVLGRRADGTIVASRFDWDFSGAAVEPVSVRVFDGAQFPELTAGAGASISQRGCRVRGMRWRLSWPGDRPRPSGVADRR